MQYWWITLNYKHKLDLSVLLEKLIYLLIINSNKTTSGDPTDGDENFYIYIGTIEVNKYYYSTLNKITQFWSVKSSTVNPKLYSVGVPIKFPFCSPVCTCLKARAILRTFKITCTYMY